MRITHVIGDLSGGGAQRVVVNLANAWVSAGREVTVLTMSPFLGESVFALDPRVVRRALNYPRPPSARHLRPGTLQAVLRGLRRSGCLQLGGEIVGIAFLRNALLDTEPDVVLSHIDMTNLRVVAAMHETGVPVIAFEHTDTRLVSVGRWREARDALYRQAFAVVASHQSTANWLAERGAAAVAIPNPLAPPPAAPTRRQVAGRRRVVMLTRFSHEKRIDLVLYAFAAIAAELPEWDLEIYGEGGLRWWLKTKAEELLPGSRIRICGFTSDPYALLRESDLLVSASWVEGFGNSIWEALACGVPVVALDCGGAIRSLVRHDIDGLLVPIHTVSALAAGLASLMSDERRRQAMAARAPEILTRYSPAAALRAWDELLDRASPRLERSPTPCGCG